MFPLQVTGSELNSQQRAALLAVADVVCLRHDPPQLYHRLISYLRTVLSFDILSFSSPVPPHKIMKICLYNQQGLLFSPIEVTVEGSASGRVWRSQEILCFDPLTKEKRFDEELGWLRDYEIRSFCILPMKSSHEKLGALGFASKRPKAFNSQDIDFLRRATEVIALSADTTLDDMELMEEVRRLRLLLEVTGSPAMASDMGQSVASILGPMQRWAVQDYVGVYLYEKKYQSLRLHMLDAELAEKMAPHGLTSIDDSLAGQAFRYSQTIVLDESSLAASLLPSVRRGRELGVTSLYLSPLLSPKGPIGVLKVARRQAGDFSPRDIQLLEQVSATVAPVLVRAQKALDDASSGPELAGEPLSYKAGSSGEYGISIEDRRETPSTPAIFSFSDPEALMESERLLTAYFLVSKVGLCILDRELRFVAINETLAQLNGVSPADHFGRRVRDVVKDVAQFAEPELLRVLSTGLPASDLEISLTPPNRTEPGHWANHFIPIKDKTGRVTHLGVIVIEVTEKKKLEELLRGVSGRLRQEEKRHQVLTEVSRILGTKADAGQAFPYISAYLRRVLRQEYASLALHDERSGQLVSKAIDFPLGKNQNVGSEIGASKVTAGKALTERMPLIFSPNELQGLDSRISAGLSSEGLKSLCCVPMFRPAGPMGVLVFGSTRAEAFHADDLALLNQVAAQLAITLENARSAREVEQLKRRLKQGQQYLASEARPVVHFENIVGESAAHQRVLDQVSIISASDATVLILGETGTGKGLVARAIHGTSKRRNQGFIVLNCAAIPTGLLESELFGHEKGAFTGAVNQKIGRLELADQGTLFLDEIGEIPLETQPKLLRVLQDHEFERLGGTRTIKVDLRLIAATNRNLSRNVAEKQFRSDLYYRLNVFPIRVPSLRERREDIPLLVRYFVQKFSRNMNRDIESIPNETMDALIRWHWPGNVRELENFIERSVILTEGTSLSAPISELEEETAGVNDPSLERLERDVIIGVLRETAGSISGPNGAAQRLGLKRTTLQSKMLRLGITRKDYLPPESK